MKQTNLALDQLHSYANVMGGQPNRWAMLLKVGAPGVMADLTLAETAAVKRFHRRIQPQIRQCYANAQKLAYTFPHSKAKYVEGCYVPHETGLLTDHAWLTLNGKVIDLTYPRPADYFGVEIPWRLVRQYLLEGECHGPLLSDPHLGWRYTALILDPDNLVFQGVKTTYQTKGKQIVITKRKCYYGGHEIVGMNFANWTRQEIREYERQRRDVAKPEKCHACDAMRTPQWVKRNLGGHGSGNCQWSLIYPHHTVVTKNGQPVVVS